MEPAMCRQGNVFGHTHTCHNILLSLPPRIHDVQVHWECVCKLLDETILRLEATRAQMCYIQQVTDKEFDWLERCEELLSGLEASRGRREVIEEEISLLEVGGGRRSQRGHLPLMSHGPTGHGDRTVMALMVFCR